MKRTPKILASLAVLALTLTGCTGHSEREKAQQESQIVNSLEKQNLVKKREREEDPDAERYLYLMSFGEIIGYYVTIGKISSSSSQIGPELETMSGYRDASVVDSPKDDGTYGPGDPGIFFFTTDDVMVETSLDYIMSDEPLAIDVPRLTK